jgi:hypothetical protein
MSLGRKMNPSARPLSRANRQRLFYQPIAKIYPSRLRRNDHPADNQRIFIGENSRISDQFTIQISGYVTVIAQQVPSIDILIKTGLLNNKYRIAQGEDVIQALHRQFAVMPVVPDYIHCISLYAAENRLFAIFIAIYIDAKRIVIKFKLA